MFLENPQQLVGKKFNHTTILEYIGKYRDNAYCYKCKCDCGNVFYIRLKNKVRPCCSSCQSKINSSKKPKKLYDYDGEQLTLKDLANKLNLKYCSLYQRIYKLKWNKERWAEPNRRK